MFWVYQVSIVSGSHIWSVVQDPGVTRRRLRVNDASGNLAVYIDRATDTTYITNDTPMSTSRNGLWTFLACTYNSAASAGQIVNIYLGTLTSVAAERTYGTATDGGGANSNNASDVVRIGNGADLNDGGDSRIGPFALVAAELSLDQIISWQFRPRVIPNTNWFVRPGYRELNQQFDWSGNGNHSSAVTSVAVADDPPLPAPFGFNTGWMGAFAGVSSTLDQEGFRWRNDDGDEDAASWIAAQDLDITRGATSPARLRMLLNATGDEAAAQYQLEYRKQGNTEWGKVG